MGTLSYFTAGSLFIVVVLPKQLDTLTDWLLLVVGFLLLASAAISAILTFPKSTLSIASKILLIGKPILILAAALSAINTMSDLTQAFGVQGCQPMLYSGYVVFVFFPLFVAAMIISTVRSRQDRK